MGRKIRPCNSMYLDRISSVEKSLAPADAEIQKSLKTEDTERSTIHLSIRPARIIHHPSYIYRASTHHPSVQPVSNNNPYSIWHPCQPQLYGHPRPAHNHSYPSSIVHIPSSFHQPFIYVSIPSASQPATIITITLINPPSVSHVILIPLITLTLIRFVIRTSSSPWHSGASRSAPGASRSVQSVQERSRGVQERPGASRSIQERPGMFRSAPGASSSVWNVQESFKL